MSVKNIHEKIILRTNNNANEIETDDGTQTIYQTVKATATATAKTSAYTVLVSDFGAILTNAGASGTLAFTLPDPVLVKNKAIRIAALAAQIIRPTPETGDAIYLNGSGVVTKYLNIAAVIGNYVDLWSDGTQYHVVGYAGVLTKEA